MSDLKKLGRIGLKTLVYFEVVSTIALAIGLLVGELLHPGAGFNIDPATLDPKAIATYTARAKEDSLVGHLLAIIPQDSYFGALARGDLLQVLLISILSGQLPERCRLTELWPAKSERTPRPYLQSGSCWADTALSGVPVHAIGVRNYNAIVRSIRGLRPEDGQ
jgi:hypothetical protein